MRFHFREAQESQEAEVNSTRASRSQQPTTLADSLASLLYLFFSVAHIIPIRIENKRAGEREKRAALESMRRQGKKTDKKKPQVAANWAVALFLSDKRK